MPASLASTKPCMLTPDSQEKMNGDANTIRTTTGEPMLAALPKDESRHLHPFCLALRLVEQGRADIPNHVAEHFDEIINQVRLLLRDVHAFRGAISPEAIALLLEIRSEQHLRDAIGQLPRLNAINRETARSLLSDMEQRFALQD